MTQQSAPGMDPGAAIANQFGVQRSQEWSRVRNAHLHLAQDQGFCAVCLGTAELQVHHIVPFHFVHLVYRGDLELDETTFPYIPTSEYPAPFAFIEGGDDRKDPDKIGTTYGSRWPLVQQQLQEMAAQAAQATTQPQ